MKIIKNGTDVVLAQTRGLGTATIGLDPAEQQELFLKLPVDVEVPGNEVSILTDVGNGNLCLLIGKATIEITTDKKFRDRMMRALTASHDYQNLQEA